MPMVRVQGPHRRGPGPLRRGELAVTELTDTRQFYYPPAPMDEHAARRPAMDGPQEPNLLEGELLVLGWTPALALVGGVGMNVFVWGVLCLGLALTGPELRYWYNTAWALPLGTLMLIWYPFFAPYWRFVIFDRRRGLVHLPGWFRGRRPDAVRWDDFGVLLAEMPGGYMGTSPLTRVYAVRPPSSLARREYPPWYRRIPFLQSGVEEHDAEQGWRRVATWMSEPPEASPWALSVRELDASIAEDSFAGNWVARRRYMLTLRGAKCFRPFYGTELLTEANWVCGTDGRWQRRPDGPRERIELPDGPEEKRVPVDPAEPLWPRLRRRLFGRA